MKCLNEDKKEKQQGGAAVKVLISIPLILVLVFAFYEGRKAYWDYRVGEMCAKDGGVEVYEKVFIKHEQFLKWGGIDGVKGIPIPYEEDSRMDVPYFRQNANEYIRSEVPTIRRSTTKFVRRADGKVLGKYVYYSRRGGDLPTWAHPSSFGCAAPKLIEEEIFIIKEKGNE